MTKMTEATYPVTPMSPDGGMNLDDAVAIVSEIDRVRAVLRELKSAFAASELDGGVKAAPEHPLYVQASARLSKLHERLMELV